MRRLGALFAICCACAVVVALGTGAGGPHPRHFEVVLDNAFGVVEGSDFRVDGVRAGTIKSIDLETSRTGPPRARVTVEATEPGIELQRDATCKVRLQSTLGEYFLDCLPGSSPERLPDGGTVPVERTQSTIPLDLVNDIMRRPARERLRLLLTSLGMGVAGRPQDLQALLRRSHPGLRETSEVLQILGRQRRVIDAFIGDADTVVSRVEANRGDVVRFIREAGDTAQIAASHREALREGVRRLPGFLAELRPTMARLRDVANRGVPLADGLRRAAPDVDTVLARLGPFSENVLPALRALGDAARPATSALREGSDELRTLRLAARDAPGLAKPLRQLLDSLDTRRRAVENDPRAAPASPPAPDPTHTDGPEGFTGFEAIANYAYWQAQSVNGFDALGHLLRVSFVIDSTCSPYANRSYKGNEAFYRKCNSWTGPNQPGLNAADPSSPNAAALRAKSGKPAKRRGERRGAGRPDAGPLPGQRDISKPHIVRPPGLQDLLRRLSGKPPRVGGGPVSDDELLLDFLLGP